MNIDEPELMEYFLEFSVVTTGFSRFYLQGTGQASLYFDTVWKVVGDELFRELLKTFHQLGVKARSDKFMLADKLRSEIFGSEKLGPIARNIIKLWYVATWYPLPKSWRDVFGTKAEDGHFVASPYAYPEGLLWQSIGVNPPGAKGPGYGTWSHPPAVKLSQS